MQKVLVQESSTTQNPQIFQLYSLIKEETPQAAGVPDRERELAPSTPSAAVQSPQNAEAQPVVSTADANDQLDTRAADTAEAVEEKPEGQEALNPGTDAFPSAPASPDPQVAAVERRVLDSTASENNYMRSMTSLLGGGEGSISSLADILVWSDTAMGMATGTLASGHSSVTDLLHNTGAQPELHLQHPGECRLCLILQAGSGDQSALHSITHMLEPVERRTVEGILSAMHYLSSHLAPRQAHAGPNLDEAPRSAASRDPGSTHALPWTAGESRMPYSLMHPYPGRLSPDRAINHWRAFILQAPASYLVCAAGTGWRDRRGLGCSGNRKVSPEGFSGCPIHGLGAKVQKEKGLGRPGRPGIAGLRPEKIDLGWTSNQVSAFLRK